MTQQRSTTTYGVAKWIVSADASRGTHTTISAAIVSASAADTIFICPGTYTENITLKSGINFAGYNSLGGSSGDTVIVGNIKDNGVNCNCTFTDIAFITNSNYIFTLTGSTSYIVASNCYFKSLNNTGFSIDSGCTVNMTLCNFDVATTGITKWVGNGAVVALQSVFTNSGLSTTPAQMGTTVIHDCSFNTAFTGPGSISAYGSIFDCSAQNITAITTLTSGSSTFYNCQILSGTASAISIGASTSATLYNCTVSSSNANAITGLGTLKYGGVVFSSTSSTINASSQTPVPLTVKQGGSAASTLTGVLIGNGTSAFTGQALTNGQLLIGSTGVSPVAAALIAGTGIGITNAAGTITIASALTPTTPGAYPYTTLATDQLILVDSSVARTIIPISSPATGQTYIIKDNVGTAALNNITVTPSGKNIDGSASYIINTNYGSITIIYNGTQWVIV